MFFEPMRVSKLITERLTVASKERSLFVAAISLYEVANRVLRKRINLSMPTQSWFDLSFFQPGLKLLPLTPEIATETSFLPGDFHGDPGDRLLAATARVHGMVLCTHDDQLVRFGQQGVYKFLEV